MSNPSVRLRLASAADEPALAAFMRQLREDDPDEGPYDESRCLPAILRLLGRPDFGKVWMIEVDGRTAGYVVLTLGFSVEFGGVAALVDELFVARGERGQGVGSEALRLTVAEARRMDIAVLALEVTRSNDAAKRVYRKTGFQDRDYHLMTLVLK